MIEILWHGRGGQGSFTAARLLGAAYVSKDDNSYALAFPSFGPERRGAPIRAFTKLDQKPIGNRSEVEKADYSIFLDDTLFSEEAFKELKPQGKILLNTKKSIQDSRVITIDADSLAAQILKLPITNTIMLGAFAAVYGEIQIEQLEKDISFGNEGTVYTNVNSALQKAGLSIPSSNYIGGLGGKNIFAQEIEGIFKELILLSNRIIMMTAGSGRVYQEVEVPFAHPRNRMELVQTKEYNAFRNKLVSLFYRDIADKIGGSEVVL